MISKTQLNQIAFIYDNIKNREYFIKVFFGQIKKLRNDKLSKTEFANWLDSWEATAELDRVPDKAKKIRRSFNRLKKKNNKLKKWEDFIQSVGIS